MSKRPRRRADPVGPHPRGRALRPPGAIAAEMANPRESICLASWRGEVASPLRYSGCGTVRPERLAACVYVPIAKFNRSVAQHASCEPSRAIGRLLPALSQRLGDHGAAGPVCTLVSSATLVAFSVSTRSRSASRPLSRLIGDGGQPPMCKSTGRTAPTPPTQA